jgi:acyl-CoA synthetase
MIRAKDEDIEAYVKEGWWKKETTLSQIVRRNKNRMPDGIAYQCGTETMTWSVYDEMANSIAAYLTDQLEVGERVLIWLPDGGQVHAAYLACERAKMVAVGVGWRAGWKELEYLSERTQSRFIILPARTPHGQCSDVALKMQLPYLVCPTDSSEMERTDELFEDGIGPSDLWFLNSTSGTTGLPKCVMQTQNRWFYFHQKAVEFAELDFSEVWMSVVPAPFGFGLWTAHVTPALLGVPCLVQSKFDAVTAAQDIAEHRVSVLCAVSSQFVMVLDAAEGLDLSSLKVVFTGGEAISATRAADLESKAGCRVLNFYGSNETGTLSGTTVNDPANKRYTTGGKKIPEMQVRLYDPDTGQQLPDIGVGQPACKGPALSLGYWDDSEANNELQTDDGWFLMGDLVEIDEEGWLRVVGRTSDFIIRGGKNISATAVEEEVSGHPAVALVAVVPMPDLKLGETAVAYVELHAGKSLTLEELKAFLKDKGVTIDWWPETLRILDVLPKSSGGKIAKATLKEMAKELGRLENGEK